ncbi:hypothetical protein BOX15_Mlig034551g3 [Macrostomum lignano]|uniref:Uncharacterized protein n=2 Tax=Macrostomum lignano TaxID=282301 RepID=A0A267H6N5_9PLAT|nr:hypothetical protein BOX15_Mlig034551g3 [Macrostomum lignano]
MPSEKVARWEVPLSDGVYIVEFEHGTTTGGRAVFINGRCIRREEFMFKLVGSEEFKIKDTHCVIRIDAVSGFAYEYCLYVNGKPLEKFTENQSKVLKCWLCPVDGKMTRVVLEKDTLDVYVNSKRVETAGEFTDDGTETHFNISGHACYIKAITSGHKRTGLLHALIVDGCEIPEASVDQCS